MSQTGLNLAALILMCGDHVGQFIPGAPFILRIAGRISAPLFLFCAREGFGHTKNRKAYLARLYIFSLIMGCINRRLAVLIPNPYCPCTNNIFSSFFILFLFIFITDRRQTGKSKNALYPLFAAANIAAAVIVSAEYGIFGPVIRAALPSIFTAEGDILVFAMGLALWHRRSDRKKLYRGYTLLCAVYLLIVLSAGPKLSFTDPAPFFKWLLYGNIQWLQILALPFMLCYNNKRGQGLKYLFYWFYPVHIVILYILGNIIYQM